MRKLIALGVLGLAVWAVTKQSKLRLWERNENTAWGRYNERIREGREEEARPDLRPSSSAEGMRANVTNPANEPAGYARSGQVAGPEPSESGEGVLGRELPRSEMP
jgi:hypothetical protein